jgi:molybdopterin synthase catalytic subunit
MIRIVESKIDREEIVQSVSTPESGAVATFDGMVRNHAREKPVTHLYYEAFEEMALKELEKIRAEAMQRWPLNGMAIVHRVGRMEIGESSVFIAVSSAHRGDAFEACRFAIDTLKTTVPIWKKEHYEDGEVWIEGYGQ